MKKIDFYQNKFRVLFSSLQMAESSRSSKRVCVCLDEPKGAEPTIEIELRPESMFNGLNNVQYKRLQPGSPEFNELIKPMNTEGFYSIAVFPVRNPNLDARVDIRTASIATENGGNANIITCYHCAPTLTNSVRSILESGINIPLSNPDFFGKGASFSKSVRKANSYSPHKGNPFAIRLMLICDVALGRTKEFDLGNFDRELVQAPEGFHSVRGFITRDYEYVVYNQNQIRPRYVVVYNFTNTALEMEVPRIVPQGFQGFAVFITTSLGAFFKKLRERSSPENQPIINNLISRLLTKSIDVKQFIQYISKLLNATSPAYLESRLTEHLSKCTIPTNALTTTTAPAAAAVSDTGAAADVPDTAPAAAPELMRTDSVEAATALISIGLATQVCKRKFNVD